MGFLLKLVTIISVLLALGACNNIIESNVEIIEGSGHVITTEREISSFSRIEINLGADLTLVQGDEKSLVIAGDDNLMDYIQTEVSGNRLIVSTPDNVSLRSSRPIQLTVGFENLTEIEVRGSSAIRAGNLDLERLMISFSGSGSTSLTGAVGNQTIIVRGMATINNLDLVSQQVSIDISGNGTIEVNAEESLDVSVAGMGNIHYTGSPTITQNISGAATITQVQ